MEGGVKLDRAARMASGKADSSVWGPGGCCSCCGGGSGGCSCCYKCSRNSICANSAHCFFGSSSFYTTYWTKATFSGTLLGRVGTGDSFSAAGARRRL